MSLSHNPQSFFNGYISTTRNMFTLSALGVTIMLYSKVFKNYFKFVKVVGFFILLFSILYGLKANYDFNIYLNYLETLDKKDTPYEFVTKNWNQWIIFSFIYIIFILLLITLIYFRKIKI